MKKLSALDIINMLATMIKEGRVKDDEREILTCLIARYTFLQDFYEYHKEKKNENS